MEQINNVLSCGTDFHEVFDCVVNGTPVCLYTYETANACYSATSPLLYIINEVNSGYNYALMKHVVTEAYGRNKMDNKITLKYSVPYDVNEDGDLLEIPVYITCWDGRISISTDVYFFRDITGFDAYRVVMPHSNGVHRGVDGGLYEDFEQSIGK